MDQPIYFMMPALEIDEDGNRYTQPAWERLLDTPGKFKTTSGYVSPFVMLGYAYLWEIWKRNPDGSFEYVNFASHHEDAQELLAMYQNEEPEGNPDQES